MFRIRQAVAALPDDATAFSHRDARYLFHRISAWTDPVDDRRLIDANRDFAAAMRPYGTGASYLNFTAEDDCVREAYGTEKHASLVAPKDTYDPGNLFRLNHNLRRGGRRRSPALA